MPPALDKSALRTRLRQALGNLPPADRAEHSRQLCRRLMDLAVWSRAGSVLGFVPLPDEPDIRPVLEEALRAGKELFLPAFIEKTGLYGIRRIEHWGRDLVPGRFGILEPGPGCVPGRLNQLDLALVPGLGFNAGGSRLGRGNGYYDRLLSEVTGCKCGLAFDCQFTLDIPKEPHDIQMNWVVLPSRSLSCPARERDL